MKYFALVYDAYSHKPFDEVLVTSHKKPADVAQDILTAHDALWLRLIDADKDTLIGDYGLSGRFYRL
jgi:hypothetical protein